MSNFIDTAKAVYAREESIESLMGNAKENRAAANAQKIGAYSEIISALAGIKLTAKGKLPVPKAPHCATPCLRQA